MGYWKKRMGRLHASIHWHPNVIGLGIQIKWVRNCFVEAWVYLLSLSFGFTYSLFSVEEALGLPQVWVDE